MSTHLRMPICFCAALLLLFAWTTASPPARASVAHTYPGKHITISLYRQRLRAWVGDQVVLSTLVTTGNPALPTPTGRFTVYARFSPYTFVSPWPAGSKFWYPTSHVSFALEFARGYFIHDAPWRSAFGPGTNSVIGTPGQNYTGTHGCVNVPYAAARFLYYWAPLGTRVHIVP